MIFTLVALILISVCFVLWNSLGRRDDFYFGGLDTDFSLLCSLELTWTPWVIVTLVASILIPLRCALWNSLGHRS